MAMPWDQFVLLLLSGFGLFPLTYIFVKWLRKIFFAFRQMDKKLNSDNVLADLGDAYLEEDEIKIRNANEQFAYSKLLALSITKTKSYRQRVADMKAIREFHLPVDEYLLNLLSRVMKNQATTEYEIRYEVLSYFLQVKEIIFGKIFLWSVYLAILISAIFLFGTQHPDTLSILQLLILIFLTLSFAVIPAFIERNGSRKKAYIFFLAAIILMFAYLASYSYLYHILLSPQIKKVSEMQIEYPAWITSSDIPEYTSSFPCGKQVVVGAVENGNPSVTTMPEINIKPDDNTKLFDSQCNPLFGGDTIPSGPIPKTAIVYYVAPREISSLFGDRSLILAFTFGRSQDEIRIRLEHPLWFWSRAGLGILISVIVIGGILSGISQLLKDQVVNTLGKGTRK